MKCYTEVVVTVSVQCNYTCLTFILMVGMSSLEQLLLLKFSSFTGEKTLSKRHPKSIRKTYERHTKDIGLRKTYKRHMKNIQKTHEKHTKDMQKFLL